MNIGQLLQSLLGEAQASGMKTLELKAGQIVRGLVLQLLSGSDALVNIGGTLVRARLEAPLKPGEATWLQVQPESDSGHILLKPVAQPDGPLPRETVSALLQRFGLKDQKPNRRLLMHMHESGIPVTKENVQTLAKALAFPSAGADPEATIRAAVIALGKNLPITEQTLAAIRQTVEGEPLLQLTEKLGRQIAGFLQNDPVSSGTRKILDHALQIIDAVRLQASRIVHLDGEVSVTGSRSFPLSGEGQNAGNSDPRPPVPAASAQTDWRKANPHISSKHISGKVANLESVTGGGSAYGRVEGRLATGERLTAETAAQAGRVPGNGPEQAMKADAGAGAHAAPLSAPSVGAVRNDPIAPQGEPSRAPAFQPGIPADPPASSSAPSPSASMPPSSLPGPSAANGSPPVMTGEESSVIVRLLQLIGFEHEKQIGRLPVSPQAAQTEHVSPPPAGSVGQDRTMPEFLQTLKGSVLQLAAMDELPGTVKELAQQIAQHVTGQQLLFMSDRGSFLSYITMLIPFADENGRQSAAVHIQSRKGKRGEMDAGNCRLFFDLQMPSLGRTWVDVHVVDRIVSIHIYNDHPLLAGPLKAYREDIAAMLEEIGYRFASLKSSPFPASAESAAGGERLLTDGTPVKANETFLYGTRPYKGVDMRI